MLKKIACTLCAVALFAAVPVWAAGALDGKSFHGKLTPVGKKSGNGDTFEFKDGQFRSTACGRDGFQYGAYKAEGSGASYSFTAQVTSKKEGTMDWRGKVNGDTVSGTAVWSKPGAAPVSFTFEGTVKK